MIDGVLIIDGSLSPKKPIYIFPEYKERTMNSLLYEIGRLANDKKRILTITEARKLLTNIQNILLRMEDPPRLDFSNNQQIQRILQMAQIQPEKLTQDDRKLLAEYQEKEKNFEQRELAEYHNRIKKNLDDLRILIQNNLFLKEMSDK